ncbi:MAG: PilZ domain-containing protein [Candidatus Omnitrophica bacterium]|nr:PilZ domain-containing protein [Candidatus Omnitrophota bacterium]
MEERRTIPRWEINQEAEVTFEDGACAIPCVVEDINYRGMRVSLRRNLFDDVFSSFKLALGIDFEINASASMAWRNQRDDINTYGLSFNRVDDLTRVRLWDYIRSRFPDLVSKQLWSGLR